MTSNKINLNDIITRDTLIRNMTRSCGCLSKETRSHLKSHGMSKTRIYRIWQHIKDKCLNPNNGESNVSINRINNNDGYYKENCEWATRKSNKIINGVI